MSQTIISPSLLSADFLNLKEDLLPFNSAKNIWLHLDVMDAHFVPNLTFGKSVLAHLHQVTCHPLDAHLMVSNPDFFADQFLDIHLHNFTFHWESVIHHDRLIKKLKSLYPSVGISLNPSTPLNVIPLYLLAEVDLVLLMSVNPGFGGQTFIPEIVNKVSALNKLREEHHLNFQIQVDGGIHEKNAPLLIKNGANNLVAGSFIFSAKKDHYLEQVEKLR